MYVCVKCVYVYVCVCVCVGCYGCYSSCVDECDVLLLFVVLYMFAIIAMVFVCAMLH